MRDGFKEAADEFDAKFPGDEHHTAVLLVVLDENNFNLSRVVNASLPAIAAMADGLLDLALETAKTEAPDTELHRRLLLAKAALT